MARSTQLVARYRVLDGQRALESFHPDAGALNVQLISAHSNGFGDSQAVPVVHQQQHVIADAMPTFLGGLEQQLYLRTAQKVLGALVSIGR